MARVVITGLGPVTSAGIGQKKFIQNIWSNHFFAEPVPDDFLKFHKLRSNWYVPLPEFALAEFGLSLAHDNILQPQDRMAILAAKLALEDAGFPVDSKEIVHQKTTLHGAEKASVIIGTGFCGMQTLLDSYVAHRLPPELVQAGFSDRRPRFSRMVVPQTMPNSPAAWTSICFGMTGSCTTLNASCASGTYAIGEAFRRVKDGYDQLVLAGGVECLRENSGSVMRSFDVLGVLTQATDGRPRPFSRGRTGFLFTEGGACLLVIEELEHALQRKAHIYAEIIDYRACSDAYNIMLIHPEGHQLQRILQELSSRVKIDYLNAHGTGTVANDQVEAEAVQCVFGHSENQPLINSTKGILGHTIGASGAIEAAVVALSVDRGVVHGNLTNEPVDDLSLPLATTKANIKNAISVSCGFGGHNAGILFRRFGHA